MGNKYGNTKTRCALGHNHDSKLEASYCVALWARARNNEILSYRRQVPFLLPGGIKHIVDFLVCVDNPDCWEVHEVKGFETAVWRMKMKLFKEKYPDIKYLVIYKNERSDKCQKRKKLKDSVLRRIKVYR